MSRLRLIAAAVLIAILSGCTSTGFVNDEGAGTAGAAVAIPESEAIGTGPVAIGIVVSADDTVLSDGSGDAVYLAAKLAASSLNPPQATLLVRKLPKSDKDLRIFAGQLLKAGAKFVIVPPDETSPLQLADMVSAEGVTLVTLGHSADPGRSLFAAGSTPRLEAVAVADEMARRRYGNIVVVAAADGASRALGEQIQISAKNAGISAQILEGAEPGKVLTDIETVVAGGVTPDAVFFAIGPESASAIVKTMRLDQRLDKIALVGNSSWPLATIDAALLKGAWYAEPKDNSLAGFAGKFRQAYDKTPTGNAALAYDLVVLAAALPQVAGEDAYSVDVLTNEFGFKGMSGSFRFDADGTAARTYTVTSVK